MSPRKSSPFVKPTNEVSLEGSAESAAPKRRSIPETLYRQPDMPKGLMKYNEYKNRIVVDSPGAFNSNKNCGAFLMVMVCGLLQQFGRS